MASKYSNIFAFLIIGALVVCPLSLYLYQKHHSTITIITNEESPDINEENNQIEAIKDPNVRRCLIIYATTSGTSKSLASRLMINLQRKYKNINKIMFIMQNIKDFDEEKLHEQDIVLFVVSSWSDGEPVASAVKFMDYLRDIAYDFRWDKNHLEGVQYALFGVGSAIYKENFCKWVIEANKLMIKLGGKWILNPTLADDQTNIEAKFIKWSDNIESWLDAMLIAAAAADMDAVATSSSSSCGCGTGDATSCCSNSKPTSASTANATSCCSNNKPTADASINDACCNIAEDDEEEEDIINRQYIDAYDEEEGDDEQKSSSYVFKGIEDDEPVDGSVMDLEDIGRSAASLSLQQSLKQQQPREMVTKLQRQALTKEGYRIIGSHSAVKLCRWTKNQMRGRGGCYKHTFYGITSYQCMEATPSLACANKCVFCWRHHKNPVGTEWRWKEDEPEYIVKEAISLHQGMIHQMKGVPGVLPERLHDAMTVRHCALSLVGEPIMYPRINEMLSHLHHRHISTFLVTNAQFPDRIRQLDPVTQLYVSVDAGSKESLQAIDRPLFKDFWTRYLDSLQAMKAKQQRTVYRLTLVKSWNMNEIDEYAGLIELGQPDFIEIKAVTFCGKSDASSLTMQNVPWHVEVCQFAEAIAARLIERGICDIRYSIATEHEHSCCILLAREDKFLVDGIWHTWINYTRFHELMNDYYESKGEKMFSSVDYMAATPDWAIYKNVNKGFDPVEKRWKRTKAGVVVEIPYQPSGSGCG